MTEQKEKTKYRQAPEGSGSIWN